MHKINGFVDFDDVLDMAPYVSEGVGTCRIS